VCGGISVANNIMGPTYTPVTYISFDSGAGEYSIPNESLVSPGMHTFFIQVRLEDYPDTLMNQYPFMLNTVSACGASAPTLADPFPFSDHTMTLTDPEYSIEWSIDELASGGCGTIEIEFFMQVDGSNVSLDSDLFEDDRTSTPFNFKVL
jgi:hypothetical protein